MDEKTKSIIKSSMRTGEAMTKDSKKRLYYGFGIAQALFNARLINAIEFMQLHDELKEKYN